MFKILFTSPEERAEIKETLLKGGYREVKSVDWIEPKAFNVLKSTNTFWATNSKKSIIFNEINKDQLLECI